MKRKQFSEVQIMALLKENKAGATADDLFRRYGISSATIAGSGP